MAEAGGRRTATFLFTDLEGSTRLLERLGDDYADVLGEHWRLLREAAVAAGGEEFGAEGDAMFFAFPTPSAAATAAIAGQLALLDHPWPEGVGVRVRMALHTGEARVVLGTWVGLALHHAARICAAGHGGQILVSPVTARRLAEERPDGLRLESLGEYRLRDVTEPQELFQLEHERLGHVFPALRTPLAAVTNLPNQITAFVGRAAEIVDLRRLVETRRVVTVVGPGGAGKTRLAYEAAGDAGPSFDDGVWIAELATVSERAGVVRVVAGAVGAAVDPAAPTDLAPVAAHLAAKRLLLVIDNAEHVVDDVADVVNAIVARAAGVHVLVTSREVLRVPGEQVWPIPPLGDEGLPLFVDRAVLARPSFSATAGDEDVVRRICAQLDGMPLAVELAAARVATMSLTDIEARLADRFELLGRGPRAASPRQRTLRALVDWSHDLLPAEEQRALRRLGTFAGSFGRARAVAVLGDDADDLLEALVAKSLVVREDDGPDGTSRFRLLETIREYALERLDETGETDAARRAHLDAMLSLANDAAPSLLGGPEQRAWLDRLDAEWPDLRRALEHGVVTDPVATVRAAGRLGPFFAIRSHVPEGRALLEAALAATTGGDFDRLRALAAAGTLARSVGDFPAARRHHEEQLELSRDDPDEERLANALGSLGTVVLLEGDLVTARQLFEESLEIRRRCDSPRNLAMALNNLGVLAAREGDFAAAEEAYVEHLAIMRSVGDDRVVGQALVNLAMTMMATGRLDAAAAALDESMALLGSVGDRRSLAVALGTKANLWRDRGDLGGALEQYAEALRVVDELGDDLGIAVLLEDLAVALARRALAGDDEMAAGLLGAASVRSSGPGERSKAEVDALEAAQAALRTRMGDDAFEDAVAAGADQAESAVPRARGWVSSG